MNRITSARNRIEKGRLRIATSATAVTIRLAAATTATNINTSASSSATAWFDSDGFDSEIYKQINIRCIYIKPYMYIVNHSMKHKAKLFLMFVALLFILVKIHRATKLV